MPENTNHPTPPTAKPEHAPAPEGKEPLLTGLRQWWDTAWAQGGPLHKPWEDLRQAPDQGWHQMANWIKTVLALLALCLTIVLVGAAVGIVTDTLHHLLNATPTVKVGVDTSGGIWGVIDNPVRSYIAAHTASLTISASTVYTLWQLIGLFGLIGGFCRSTGARLTWTAWGAASIAAVWSATPADSRVIATTIAALAWTAASTLALRGLSLRPSSLVHIHNTAPEIRNEIHPQIHIPAPTNPPTNEPDNVRKLRR